MHANNVVHFAIHADNVERARAFYSKVFGWEFQEWGPPGFYLIQTGTAEKPGIRGALQKRTDPLSGSGMLGFECSIAVSDLRSTTKKIEEQGGTIVVKAVEIPKVGSMVKFHDTEGNLVVAMQYEEHIDY